MQRAVLSRLVRVARLVAIAVAIEASLFAYANTHPAMAGLFGPVYWIVAAAFAVGIVRVLRRRTRRERRAGDRRRSLPGDQ